MDKLAFDLLFNYTSTEGVDCQAVSIIWLHNPVPLH